MHFFNARNSQNRTCRSGVGARRNIGAQNLLIVAQLAPVDDERAQFADMQKQVIFARFYLFNLRIFQIQRARKSAAAGSLYRERRLAEVVNVERIAPVRLRQKAQIQNIYDHRKAYRRAGNYYQFNIEGAVNRIYYAPKRQKRHTYAQRDYCATEHRTRNNFLRLSVYPCHTGHMPLPKRRRIRGAN